MHYILARRASVLFYSFTEPKNIMDSVLKIYTMIEYRNYKIQVFVVIF
jgi:hypothetical protein